MSNESRARFHPAVEGDRPNPCNRSANMYSRVQHIRTPPLASPHLSVQHHGLAPLLRLQVHLNGFDVSSRGPVHEVAMALPRVLGVEEPQRVPNGVRKQNRSPERKPVAANHLLHSGKSRLTVWVVEAREIDMHRVVIISSFVIRMVRSPSKKCSDSEL